MKKILLAITVIVLFATAAMAQEAVKPPTIEDWNKALNEQQKTLDALGGTEIYIQKVLLPQIQKDEAITRDSIVQIKAQMEQAKAKPDDKAKKK